MQEVRLVVATLMRKAQGTVYLVERDVEGTPRLVYATANPTAMAAVQADRRREQRRRGMSDDEVAGQVLIAPKVLLDFDDELKASGVH